MKQIQYLGAPTEDQESLNTDALRAESTDNWKLFLNHELQ